MKIPKWLLACGAAAAGAAGLYTYHRHHQDSDKASLLRQTDFKDAYHLRILPQSQLDRRMLPLESSINMRDIGGYAGSDGRQTRWGKMIRSEELCHLTPEDEKKLDEYGITHVFDFRDEDKAQAMPDYIPKGAMYVNIPILKGAHHASSSLDYSKEGAVKDFMKGLYKYMVEERADAYAQILHLLADDPDAKILFHCTNGKDRTGFLAAMLLLLAGVPEEVIVSDYSLTNLTFDEAFDKLGTILQDDMQKNSHFKIPKRLLRDFFGVDPAWLQLQLDYIRDQGGIDAYLIANTDLTEADLARVRENITERIPADV